ncbi:RND efflux system, outer membrane lipoprotein, NodT family [Oxalobacteraceae bacterium IMCC9480]|nr:RND efflux system, outer membrane lipoprotein, NodT family [Oxalobacteraceae bacterium IMCC9480]
MYLLPRSRWLALAVLVATAGGCAVGPTYEQPALATPAAYKEVSGWVRATPADALDRGTWWTLFDDAGLNALAGSVEVSNQNIAAAAAAYAQARALVREQRAGLFPVVSLDGSGRRAGGESAGAGNSAGGSGNNSAGNTYQASIGASWEPDVWGRLGRTVDSASAGAQASAADLASALLAAQGELAINYFSLRQTDAQSALLQSTIAAYQRSLEIAQNRYQAGVAPKTDLLQAQTQLANAQAELVGLERQRTQLEHAIAVLVGQAPGNFTLVIAPWAATLPQVPIGVPSTLLQRRPDIAAAERRVAAANEQIGIAQSALYPNLNLSASYGVGATRVSDLFSASTSVWSLGLSAAQVLFNAGATRARIDEAQAAQQQAAARYRQTVLVAFQGVEDQLAATRVLMQQQPLRELASRAADETEVQTLNRYRAGQVAYTEVVTAQASAFSARRALVQLASDRQVTAVALIQALGGGWGN